MKLINSIIFIFLFFFSGIAHADFQAATGQLTSPTSTGHQSISGLSFTPKIVIFYGSGVTAATQNVMHMFGAATGSSNMNVMADYMTNTNTFATANFGRVQYNTRCISYIYENAGAAADFINADLVSLDSTGFTINWDTVQASGYPVNYIAMGGSDLNASVGTYTTGTGTGNQSITGLSFQPSAVFIYTAGTAANTLATAFDPTVGMGNASNNVNTEGFLSDTNTGSSIFEGGANQVSTSISSKLTTGLTVNFVQTLVSLDATGFTVNLTTNSSAKSVGYIAISGIKTANGVFNLSTSTGNQSVTGLGFQPSVVILSSIGKASTSSPTSGFSGAIGAGTSSSSRYVSSFASGNPQSSSSTQTGSDGSNTKILQFLSVAFNTNPTVLADADLVSLDSTGFTINNTTTDATSREVIYWALGLNATSNGSIINNGIIKNAIIN